MTIVGYIVVDQNGRQCPDSYAETRRDAVWHLCGGQTAWSALYKMGYRCVKMTGEKK